LVRIDQVGIAGRGGRHPPRIEPPRRDDGESHALIAGSAMIAARLVALLRGAHRTTLFAFFAVLCVLCVLLMVVITRIMVLASKKGLRKKRQEPQKGPQIILEQEPLAALSNSDPGP
jgi:hypothetical protein